MARGNLFFCSRDIDEVNQGEDETDLYDQREYLAVEYVQTNIEDTSKGLIRWLIEAVKELGGETGTEENAEGEKVPYIIIGNDVKRGWFKDRFATVKRKLSEMSLEDFACRDVTGIRMLIQDEYSDCMYEVGPYGGYPKSMDEWIRDVDPNQKNYLSNTTVLLH